MLNFRDFLKLKNETFWGDFQTMCRSHFALASWEHRGRLRMASMMLSSHREALGFLNP